MRATALAVCGVSASALVAIAIWAEWSVHRDDVGRLQLVNQQLHAQREILASLGTRIERLSQLSPALSCPPVLSGAAPAPPGAKPEFAGQRASDETTKRGEEVVDETSAAATVHAEDLLDRAMARGRWSVDDERSLLDTLGQMTAQGREDLLTRRAVAVNAGKLKMDAAVFVR